jgi:ParB-like chromosome segregation protein Spo0J
MNETPAGNIQKRELAGLVPHPRQAALAPAPSPAEVERLAAALKRDGLDNPIEILPDGTQLGDPAPLAAARRLGWHEVECRVRDDLAAQGKGAAERRLIENALARQPDHLGQARCLAALKRLQYAGTLPQCGRAELRKELVGRLNTSGRSVDRLLRVVTGTPLEVQDAVAAGELALTQAEKVAGLKKAAREQVAEEIRSGKDPAGAVRRHAPKGTGRHKKVRHAVDAFLLGLERGVDDLGGRIDQVGIRLSAREAAALDGAEEIINAIRQRAAAAAPPAQAAP